MSDPAAVDPAVDPGTEVAQPTSQPASPEAAPTSTSEAPTAPQAGMTLTPPASDPQLDALRAGISTFVEEWWNDHFPGSVVGRNTEIWNYVHSAKEALKSKLETWLK